MPRLILLCLAVLLLGGCHAAPRAGEPLARIGDEIMVCGQLFHTGAPVVLWTDPGGYDAYRVEKRFVPWQQAAWPTAPGTPTSPATPNRYSLRYGEAGKGPAGSGAQLHPDLIERYRGGNWDLPALQTIVDQFVIHYDVAGTSRQCFRILHDSRGLSVHFLLDVDGTIYQTLDLKERAWHATTSNDRSIGIEIAQIGAYPATEGGQLPPTLRKWYAIDNDAPAGRRVQLSLPQELGDGGIRTPNFVARPARDEPIVGVIQGESLMQFDFTPEQYESLTKLTAALCTVFPNLACDYPRNEAGGLLTEKIPDDQLITYRGLLGHYHIQQNKTDPGPAFDWERVTRDARKLMPR